MNKTIIHRSLAVFYRSEGEGEGQPILLLHGFMEDGSIWDRQVDYLKRGFRLLIPDLPGSGGSSLLPGETSMEDMADYVKAILDAEGIERCVMIGHSMGGYIALAFAEKFPDRLRAFGLFHSSAYPDSEGKKTIRRKSIEFIRKHGAPEFIRQSIPNLFAEHYREEHPEIVAGLIDRHAGFNPGSLIYYYNAMIDRPDRTQILKDFPGPVLFIIGDRDNAIPLADSLQQSHIPGLSYIHILENCGHVGMLEKSSSCKFLHEIFTNS